MTTTMQSGYAYQVRYAVYRAVWIAAGRDPLSGCAATVRLEQRLRDRAGKPQWVDIVIEDEDERLLELIETKEHDGFLPLSSVDSFLLRADAMRAVVPAGARFRFVCNQKLTEGLDLSNDAVRAATLQARGVAALDGSDVDWELGLWNKASLVDRTMVLLARDGGDARDLYFRLHARASAQIALRRPSHAKAAARDTYDLLSDYYTESEHRRPPPVPREPGLSIAELRDSMNLLARERPDVRRIARKQIESALRRQLFREQRITTEAIFVEPLAGLTSPVHGTPVHHGGDATSLLLRWMNDLYEERAPREPLLLLGTFGIGKSTLLTAFAHAVFDLASWVTPLPMPLRDLVGVAQESLREELERYIREKYHVDFSQPSSGDSLRYLLLCDGFDELNLYYSRRDVQEWVEGAYGVLRSLAQRRDTGVIVSSRPILFMEHQRRKVMHQPVLELADFDEARIDLWCANYRRARPNVSAEFSFRFLRARRLDEVAQTPIVLYMLALLYEDGWLEKKNYTRTEIFRTFVDWTESGGYGGEQKHLLPENYREMLQDIAWFIFRGGEERLPENTILALLQEKYGTVTREQIRVGSNLLVAHMLQPARGPKGEENLIEFTHQSFREYLVAERLWRLLEPQRGGTPLTSEVWADAAGAVFTRAEVMFLEDMVTQLGVEEAQWLYERLEAVQYVVNELNIVPRTDVRTVVARTMLAYLLRVKLFRRLIDLVPKRALPEPPTDVILRTLLDFAQHCNLYPLLRESLGGLRLAPEADLTNMEFEDVELHDVVLDRADCKRAVLPGVSLQNSVFIRCDFSHSSIAAQYLFRTRFVDCNFTSAEIHIENELELGATWHNTFSGCDFTNAVFTGLVMGRSRFIGNTWKGASIQTDEDAVIDSSTLDAPTLRFFRSQKVKVTNPKKSQPRLSARARRNAHSRN